MDKGHLLFISATTWCATGKEYSIADACKIFDADKMAYWIWYVPVPHGAEYSIECYAPQLEGAYVMEFVEFHKGKKIKKQGA